MAALTDLTEESIRSRVNLKHDNLEDVKSLSLPGTYHEKITSVGSSLRKFTRLKHLDLSRNALTCLSGLEHLQLLEKLNLYYNGISSLEELKKLKHNTKLVEIDLRLNPVARDEADYRLYLIHLLPNLQKLDDRGVRDRERQAALIHFTSSQAAEFTAPTPPPTPEVSGPQSHPRVAYVQAKHKRTTVLDDDDVEVLDLIARTGGDLSKPRQITGSAAREDHVQEYTLEALKSLPDKSLATRNLPVQGKTITNGFSHPEPVDSRYPNITNVQRDRVPSPPSLHSSQSEPQQIGDPNLKYTDEMEAYTKYKGHGFFTPNPDFLESQGFDGVQPQSVNENKASSVLPPGGPPAPKPAYFDEDPSDGVEVYRQPYPVQKLEFDASSHQQPQGVNLQRKTSASSSGVTLPDNMGSCQKKFLSSLLDLVDKYWNGSRSLHKNPKFKSLAVGLLEGLERGWRGGEDMGRMEQQGEEGERLRLREENRLLKEREASYKQITTNSSLNETQLKQSLKQAYEDVEALRSHLQKYVNENKRLQEKLKETEAVPSVNASSLSQSQIEQIEKQNGELREEVEKLRARLRQSGQLQELATMLQESHKSLVQTNDHLLKEIDETRYRHQHEVRQLHWSYDQLKKSMNSFHANSDITSASYLE